MSVAKKNTPIYNIKRITSDLNEFKNHPVEGVDAFPVSEDSVIKCKAIIKGPKGTPYEGHDLELSVRFGTKYPFQPPKIKFVSKVFHPNVDSKRGGICVDILGANWSPAMTLQKILLSISLLLEQPNINDPLDVQACDQYKEDIKIFNMLAIQALKQGKIE